MQCEIVKELFNMQNIQCCESCHEDDNTGHGDDLWFTLGKDTYHVCCAIGREFEKRDKEI